MKISIVIPTRDRCEFLPHCIRTALACEDDALEVVVSNNNSQDQTRQVLADFRDPRLKAVHTDADLSMRQNFEFALSHATGDYIIFIGDDDGVIPNGIAALRHLLNQDQPDAVIWRHITYLWPRREPVAMPGQLKFRCRDFCGPVYPIDVPAMLDDLCHARRTNYRDALNIYHGCISRRVIDQIKQETAGDYFQGQCPDINSALSNLTAARLAYWLRNPVTIAGAGEKSTGSTMKKSNTAITPSQHSRVSNFVALANIDPVQPEASCQIRSLLAHTYANLDRVLKTHPSDNAAIDHQAWRAAILKEMQSVPLEHRPWDLIESLFQQIDPSYQRLGLTEPPAPPTATANPEMPIASPPKKRKSGRVATAHLTNIATAASWIQRVTGKPYRPTQNIALALLNQTMRSVVMQAKIGSVNQRKPDALLADAT